MPQRICTVPDCRRPHNCRGLCRAHYDRLRQYGDIRPDVPVRPLPLAADRDDVAARILARCEYRPDGCIEWVGPVQHGYGRITWQGRQWQAHRAIWTATVGAIPTDDDWTIDHLCRNRACQNVEHMEVVTRIENTVRGGGLAVAQAKNLTRSHCPNGHRYTPDTTYQSSTGFKMCKTCKRAAWRKRQAITNQDRRAQYRARRAAGASPYQAVHAEWWKYPETRPA